MEHHKKMLPSEPPGVGQNEFGCLLQRDHVEKRDRVDNLNLKKALQQSVFFNQLAGSGMNRENHRQTRPNIRKPQADLPQPNRIVGIFRTVTGC